MPVIVDHDQRRAEIVTAAWQALAAAGSEGTTMRAIANRAGCTTGRLTHYFRSRDEILVAALRAVHTSAANRMAAAMSEADGMAALRAVLGEALPLDTPRRREWKVWIAFWGLAAAKPELRQEQRARYVEWRRLIQALLARCVALGELPPLDVAAETDRLLAMVDGLGLQATVGGSARAVEATLDHHLAALVN